jgi:hypothetical protein
MKKWVCILSSLAVLSFSASARDDINSYSVVEALQTEQAKAKLGTDIAFYFGEQSYGTPEKNFGVVSTNKKTNAFNKSDREACEWVFLSAMIALKNRAMSEGANAVVEIKSNYKGTLTSSEDTFRCGAGTFLAGVALTGKLVKL